MNIFYCPAAILNESVELDETESYHLTKVLRKKEDEELYAFDGKGNLFHARIEAIGKKHTTVHIIRLAEADSLNRPRLHIAIALPKNIERFEWFAEKATEIGISEITPLVSRHSERRMLKPERIEKIIISACKQSLKLHLPKLNPVIKFEELVPAASVAGVLTGNGGDAQKFIASCGEKAIHLKDACHRGFDAFVMIGPEGDFSRDEILLAEQNEFETVSLGKSRLRLETAGIYAATVFNLMNE